MAIVVKSEIERRCRRMTAGASEVASLAQIAGLAFHILEAAQALTAQE